MEIRHIPDVGTENLIPYTTKLEKEGNWGGTNDEQSDIRESNERKEEKRRKRLYVHLFLY